MRNLPTVATKDFVASTLINKALFIFVLAYAVVAEPGLVFAQTLGEMMCSVSHNIAPFAKLFTGLAYITGSILIGSGLFQLAFYTDVMSTGRQYGISRPKGYMVAGSALLALPAFLQWLINSLFTNGQNTSLGNGITGCVPIIDAGGAAGNVGLDGLMINLVDNIKSPMVFMLSVLCVLIGIFMVARGLIKGSKFGQDAKASVPNILANVIIGALLFTVGTSVDTIMATTFGDSSVWGSSGVVSAIASDFGGNTAHFQQAVTAALHFFQMVGMIAFIRGWLILRDAVEGQGQKTVAQGLTHIFGGVLAMNIFRFLDSMDSTFGTGFL